MINSRCHRDAGRESRLIWWLFAAVVLLLLPFLLYKSQSVDYQAYNLLLEDISHIRELDTQLNEAVLVVNQTPWLSYDPLTRASNALVEGSNQLWDGLDSEIARLLQTEMTRFLKAMRQKRELVEGFKSHHAVLKNSSTYFSHLAIEVINNRTTQEEIARTINSILHTIHNFRLDGSSVHLERINTLRGELQQELESAGEADTQIYKVMHLHINTLLRYAIEVNDLIDEVLHTELDKELMATRQHYTELHDHKEVIADRYRTALFAVSLLLALAVAITLLKQRRSMCELDLALNELEFQKQALDEHAIVSIADVKGNITYANPKFCEISGYTLAELIGENHRLVKSDEHPTAFYREMWRTIASGKVWHGEIRNINHNGDGYWVRSTIVPFLNKQGKPFKYVSIRTDITERKTMEQEIEKSHKFLTGITENVGESVYVLDGNGNCTFLNREAERQLGWSKEELLGQNIHDKIHFQREDGSHLPQHECPAHISIAHGEKFTSEDEFFTRKDGSLFPVSMISVPLTEGGKDMGSVTVFQDISLRRESERELLKAKEQAEQANKMKSEFLANMSHEIRTPMNGMLGTIELLRDTPLNESQYEYVEAAHRSSEHLLTLINDILDLSKFESGNIELESVDFDLTEALEDLADLYAANAQGKGLELNWGIDTDVPEWVKGDRVRLWQVLTNLTGNAIKFTEHGSVSVKVTVQQADESEITLRFEIVDTGIGIAKEAQQRIFNAFEQADGTMTRRFGGTGLGLSLSKRLVGLMGGEIGIDSQPDVGSTFWFTARLNHSQVTEQTVCDSVLQQKRVLIVDDIALNRMILERFTQQWGMSADCVNSGDEALQALDRAAERGEAYNLILLDHKMHGMDGLTVAAHIRQQPRFATTKLVLHSSEAEKLSKQPEKVSNLDAVLRKPLRRRTLHNQLLRLCGTTGAVHQQAESAAQAQWLNQRILLVDDNDVNRMIARGMLEKQGITILDQAENGQQALEMAKAEHYDLILMDVQMPVMNGHEATRAIRQHEGDSRHTTIVALTAHAFAEDIERCINAGMDDYLSKPLQQSALQNILSQWLSKSEDDKTMNEPVSQPQAAAPVSPVEDSPIDQDVIATLIEVLGEDGIKMAVDSYVTDAPKQIANMRESLHNGDWELFSRSAHTLKGSSGNFGAKPLAELSQRLEQMGRAKEGGGASALIDEIDHVFESVTQALEQYTRS